MLIVENDPEAVEADLVAGRLHCPVCGVGVLARWGNARRRVLRDGQAFRPRRGACKKGASSCEATHVLLPDACLLRRRDSAETIGAALSAIVTDREDYTDVAARIGVPPDTVFDWVRRFRRWAKAIRAHFTRWLVALAPGRALPGPGRSMSADALEVIGAVAKQASLSLPIIRGAWSWVSVLTAGALLSNTSSPWPTPD